MCKIAVICLLFSALLMGLFLLFWRMQVLPSVLLTNTGNVSQMRTVVIDAGHGGRDGGAVSADGIVEKVLNLEVSLALRDILLLYGMAPVMTRTEDTLLCAENDPALKGKIKSTDLKNRLKIAQEYKDGIFVSIHMNMFPIEKYSGLQVYYSKNHEKSYSFALAIQNQVQNRLQPLNERKAKPAGKSIFLLDRIETPAILIECGFLSNPNEAKQLSDPSYQTQLALVVAYGIWENFALDGE